MPAAHFYSTLNPVLDLSKVSESGISTLPFTEKGRKIAVKLKISEGAINFVDEFAKDQRFGKLQARIALDANTLAETGQFVQACKKNLVKQNAKFKDLKMKDPVYDSKVNVKFPKDGVDLISAETGEVTKVGTPEAVNKLIFTEGDVIEAVFEVNFWIRLGSDEACGIYYTLWSITE